jgi:hypothetical protein
MAESVAMVDATTELDALAFCRDISNTGIWKRFSGIEV